ncbi:hypothetical protein WNY78_06020 [Psychroserpens sp. AS72]|uniref:hypothetical protein n=1 Tax=Psychroserpens sp. AS72 TaxID=3135775 RepID=UPI003174D36F
MANCIFCNCKKVSKEHLWGKWWTEYYPPSKKSMLIRDDHTITKRDSNNEVIEEKGQFSNVGNSMTKTTKVVCENCNNTWMSQIENDMKKAFHSIYIKKKETISTNSELSIRKWMYLKYCLIDRAYSDQSSMISSKLPNFLQIKEKIEFQRTECWSQFLEGKVIPSEFHFFIARSTKDCKFGSFNHLPLMLMDRNNSLNVNIVDTCMFFNGHFIGIVTSHDGIAKHLLNYTKDENLNPFRLLNMNTQELPIDFEVHGSVLEEEVLSILENKLNRKLRRNFI